MPLLHRLAATGTVVLLALLLLVGCTGSPDPSPADNSPEAEAGAAATAPVTLADLSVRRLAVAREPFCSVVPASVVAAALQVEEAPPVREDADGDRVRVGAGVRDVAHEHGCTWEAGGATARAWVAVPPATRALADELAESLRTGDGCTELTDEPSYGARSVAVSCEEARGTRVVRAGVLGEAWLGCSLEGGRGVAAEQVERRSDPWCAGLLQALAGAAAETG